MYEYDYSNPYGGKTRFQPSSTWQPTPGDGSSQSSTWQSGAYPQPIIGGRSSELPSTWQSVFGGGGGSSQPPMWQSTIGSGGGYQPTTYGGGSSQPPMWQSMIGSGGGYQPTTYGGGSTWQPTIGDGYNQLSTYGGVRFQPHPTWQPMIGGDGGYQHAAYGGGRSQPPTWQPTIGGGDGYVGGSAQLPSTWIDSGSGYHAYAGANIQPPSTEETKIAGGSSQPPSTAETSTGGGGGGGSGSSHQKIDEEIIQRPKIILDLDGGTSTVAKPFTKVERIVDPDGECSSLCTACTLPIFSTPSISFSHGGDHLFLHQQCDNLPLQLPHELHPQHDLVPFSHLLHPPPPDAPPTTCNNCNQICGTSFYHCPNPNCNFRLDLLCALQLKIVHRSHLHAITVIRQRDSSFLTCSACDTKHDSPSESPETLTLSYLCSLCGFWIHPDCASLTNAIHYEKHQHSLFLTYNLPISDDSKCLICSNIPKKSTGVYFCLSCPNYLVRIGCAVKNPDAFKPLFIRDAKASDLGRLPMANEYTSLIPYIRQDITQINRSSSVGDSVIAISDYYEEKFHAHPLIFHQIDDGDGDDDESCRVCNSCVQSVSPPFYSCSQCPDFFLHSCCAHLPIEITHRAHEEHRLLLHQKAPKSDSISSGFTCKGCDLWSNGFAYSCKTCDFTLDAVCAMINPAITHESHKNTHILFMSRNIQFDSDQICNCCSSILTGICYECSICRNFKLHLRCALLPTTVLHVFDDHPLRLTTTAAKESKFSANGDGADDDGEDFCEVCEEHIKKERWYYSCSVCNQSFHVDCIPSVDRLSKIKLGSDVRVEGHGCSVALVRRDNAVCGGRRCGICGEILKLCDDGLAYECSNCFFGLHQNCAKKCLLKS